MRKKNLVCSAHTFSTYRTFVYTLNNINTNLPAPDNFMWIKNSYACNYKWSWVLFLVLCSFCISLTLIHIEASATSWNNDIKWTKCSSLEGPILKIHSHQSILSHILQNGVGLCVLSSYFTYFIGIYMVELNEKWVARTI